MSNGFVINIDADIDAFVARARRIERDDLPFVTAYALTKTASDIKNELVTVMARVFDRPTRFTLNSLYLKTATKTDLSAAVLFKDDAGSIPANRYLGPEVDGGHRVHKSHELRLIRAGLMRSDQYAVPGAGAKLDQYGNISGGEIERILSQVGAAEQFAGYKANATKRSLARAKRKGVGRYFAISGHGRLPDGIYLRRAAQSIVPVIMFVRRPSYRKRLPFYETAKDVFRAKFAAHFRQGMMVASGGVRRAA